VFAFSDGYTPVALIFGDLRSTRHFEYAASHPSRNIDHDDWMASTCRTQSPWASQVLTQAKFSPMQDDWELFVTGGDCSLMT
jgi:hypothetical protein